jgi:hypothetical protein
LTIDHNILKEARAIFADQNIIYLWNTTRSLQRAVVSITYLAA